MILEYTQMMGSKIAKFYKMGCMKSICILNEALAPHFLQETGSPLTSRVVTQFIDICCTTGPGGPVKLIFNKINKILQKLEIPWSNCVQFSFDGTGTNMGIRNSIKSRVLERKNNCYFFGALVILSIKWMI